MKINLLHVFLMCGACVMANSAHAQRGMGDPIRDGIALHSTPTFLSAASRVNETRQSYNGRITTGATANGPIRTAPEYQAIKVTGKVTSMADGTGLPGVNVVVKDTQNGTITDLDGNYSLEVEDANSTLVYSYVGYVSEEVNISGRSVVNVSLSESIEALQEIVVTALGIKRDERSLGYAVGKVDGKDLDRVAQENVLNSLAGKVPGVTINSTGGTGSSVSMVIRGATSLSSDNQPLFVVDGVPLINTLNNVTQIGSDNRVDYGNAISDLNPDDIASITVLNEARRRSMAHGLVTASCSLPPKVLVRTRGLRFQSLPTPYSTNLISTLKQRRILLPDTFLSHPTISPLVLIRLLTTPRKQGQVWNSTRDISQCNGTPHLMPTVCRFLRNWCPIPTTWPILCKLELPPPTALPFPTGTT